MEKTKLPPLHLPMVTATMGKTKPLQLPRSDDTMTMGTPDPKRLRGGDGKNQTAPSGEIQTDFDVLDLCDTS